MIETQPRVAPPARALPPAWRFWGPLGVQLLLVAAVPLPKVMAYTTGTQVVLEAAPLDPSDPLRGRYVTLGYAIARDATMHALPGWNPAWNYESRRRPLYFTLAPGQPAWRAVAVSERRPTRLEPNQVALAATLYGGRPDFGLETYYLPDARGEALGELLRRPKPVELVEARVSRWGEAVLTGLTVNGQHF